MTAPGLSIFSSVALDNAFEKEASARSGVIWLLHPIFITVSVWSIVFGLWAALPSDVFAEVTGSDRYVSLAALGYFGLALTGFVGGLALAPHVLGSRLSRSVRATETSPAIDRFLLRAILVALAIGTAANLMLFVLGMMRAGGPTALLALIISGTSWAQITDQYFAPARIQGLTIWVQLNFAVAPLAVIGLLRAQVNGNSARPFVLALLAGFINTLVLSVTQSDRLETYEFTVAAAACWVAFRAAQGRPIITRTSVVNATLFLGVIVSLWFASEYGRTYLARFGPSLSTEERVKLSINARPSASSVAANQLLAYAVSGVNNGMYAIDNFRDFTGVYHVGKGVFTTFTLDESGVALFSRANQEKRDMLNDIYFRGAYTVYSAPAYAFMDLSWGGIVIMFWVGLVIGSVYYRSSHHHDLWAMLIYPMLVVGLIDSYRIFYWSESRVLAPMAFILIACAFFFHSHREETPR